MIVYYYAMLNSKVRNLEPYQFTVLTDEGIMTAVIRWIRVMLMIINDEYKTRVVEPQDGEIYYPVKNAKYLHMLTLKDARELVLDIQHWIARKLVMIKL